MTTTDRLICVECGAGSPEGPLCSQCGKPLQVDADKLPDLLAQRLLRNGFVAAPQLAEAFERTIPDFRSLLLFPDPFAPPRTIRTLYMTVIVRCGVQNTDTLSALATSIRANGAALLPGLPRSSVVQITVCLVYSDSLSPEFVRAHRLARRERRTRVQRPGMRIGSLLLMALIPIDSTRGQAHFARRYVEPDRQVRAALKQLHGVTRPKTNPSFIGQYLRLVFTKPLEGLRHYLATYSLLDQTDMLAYQITSGRLQTKELFAAIGVSAVVAGLAAELFGLDLDLVNLGNSILDQIVGGLIVMTVFLVSAGLTHLPLRLVGGRASFRHTFVATTFVSAVGYPVLVAFVGGMVLLGMPEQEAWDSVQYVAGGLAVWVLAPVHGLSVMRTLLSLFLLPAAALLLIIAIGEALF